MVNARESDQVNQQDLYRPKLPYRAPEYTEAVARPRPGSDGGTGMTMGIPYDAPTAGAGASDSVPVTRAGLAWRIVASLVLAAVGVNAIVRSVPLWQSANVDPTSGAWVGAVALLILAGLALAYPIVNLVRWVRTARSRRQRPAA
ncbi:hypothetical protein EDF64_10619 [Curtobacterium flaccumfaciens]|uniref:Uncharacterized protein n=1 Tax=Curtobacterium flaccumfaciens TaxID=2035 RepID=A0A4R6DGL0_9MICO|nr:hypothetical protein [Curtobacterium flaccumfaciens]TDN43846.1 hypothetical protein EDF64_10619 [Curtobacterium flaccumfaciens]